MKTSSILITQPSADYELIDSGEGEKLERFGAVRLSRPDPQALWARQLPATEWNKADAYFTRDAAGAEWSYRSEAAKKAAGTGWPIAFGGLTMIIKPTAFKHTGLFPEHATSWDWMRGRIEARSKEQGGAQDIEVLNLFGYTGGASLACAQAGAKVVHIDSSKAAVTWARENAAASGLADKPIRWIIEDARLFVEREIKRGRSYDAIMMDPPAFGHGVNNELWKIEENLLPLIEDCKKLLKPQPLFFLINGYSAGYSAVAYENILLPLVEKYGGSVEIGELTIEEKPAASAASSTPSATKKPGRLLPAGIFARWTR